MTDTRQRLKSWLHFFAAFEAGAKKHDLRDISDRTFEVGEVVVLEEFDHIVGRYTGRKLDMMITYITDRNHPCALSSFGLDRNMAILSFAPMSLVYE